MVESLLDREREREEESRTNINDLLEHLQQKQS